jgi:hypothetical protein
VFDSEFGDLDHADAGADVEELSAGSGNRGAGGINRIAGLVGTGPHRGTSEMITASQAAKLCRNLYDPVPAAVFKKIWTYDNVVVGLAGIDDVDVLVLRGSAKAEDWMRDACAVPEWHPQLGFCHAGFLAGMDDVFAEVRTAVGAKVAITGHSLGGARARILAGLFACNGVPIDTLCVFGSPKPAFVNLARIVEKSGINHSSYRNRNDVVPTVPLTFAPVLDFVHTEQWTDLNAAPDAANLEPLRDHSIDLYVQGLMQT